MASQVQNTIIILRRKQVEARTGLSRSSIYARLKLNPKRPADYDPTFPLPISLGAKAVGWIQAEIDGWLAAQVEKSRRSDRSDSLASTGNRGAAEEHGYTEITGRKQLLDPVAESAAVLRRNGGRA